jgi:hypothetical protein
MIMATIQHPIESQPLTFHNALEQAELLARQHLPEILHGRLACAAALVRDGKVLQLDDGHTWEVASASVAGKIYSINGQGCDCKDAQFTAPQGRCKHVIATWICRKALALIQQAQAPQAETPVVAPQEEAPVAAVEHHEPVPGRVHMNTAGEEHPAAEAEHHEQTQGIDPKFIVWIQQRPFVRHTGLLKLAHDRGLQSLTVEWTHNSEDLSLAHAVAIFADGRRFEENGDASPQSVGKKVVLHFRRCACTRASARALRLALGCDLVAVEELAESE